jgi:mono/diheme cytochrome c family protein
VLAVVTNGVTEKGMPNWGQMIGQEKVARVTAYVVSTNGKLAE